jgi:Kdo2-lipid IVA lauroyltransferase/acyltransferase
LEIKLPLYRLWLKIRNAGFWVQAQFIFLILRTIRLLPPRAAINFMDRAARIIGPFHSRHRIALANLKMAFPEKSDAEREEIALGMWGNMARLAAEYVFFDQIFDYIPKNPNPGIVAVDGEPLFEKLRDEHRPRIFFTAHTGNFELLPICAASHDLEITALFRPPNNPYVAKEILKTRRTNMGGLVPSQTGAVLSLANVLAEGGNIGILVDQFFHQGPDINFFGHLARTSHLLPRLARQFDADIYPARCIRLPGGRYRLELYDKIELPRSPDGKIDVNASCQMINDTVEGWIREYPDQWMWFHKRWKRLGRPAKKAAKPAPAPIV